MNYEHCCECDAHTGRAGAGDGSLYAGDWGPYCEECWYDLPGNLVDKYTALETENAQLRAELTALREQEPVRFERRSFRKGELFRDWHASTANEAKSIGERMKFVNEFGEEWIHETRKLYTTPQPAIPEGWVLEFSGDFIFLGREDSKDDCCWFADDAEEEEERLAYAFFEAMLAAQQGAPK